MTTTVNLDFELKDANGHSLGNCAEFCANQIQNYINNMTQRGYTEIAAWCADYQTQLKNQKHADMDTDQYNCVKNYYTSGLSGLVPEVLSQILAAFKD